MPNLIKKLYDLTILFILPHLSNNKNQYFPPNIFRLFAIYHDFDEKVGENIIILAKNPMDVYLHFWRKSAIFV